MTSLPAATTSFKVDPPVSGGDRHFGAATNVAVEIDHDDGSAG
jgi:hypothetical protein